MSKDDPVAELRIEADLSDRPGQMERLLVLADEMERRGQRIDGLLIRVRTQGREIHRLWRILERVDREAAMSPDLGSVVHRALPVVIPPLDTPESLRSSRDPDIRRG